MNTVLVAHELLCVMAFYSVFCRMVRSDRSTNTAIRVAFQFLGTVASLGIVGPLAFDLRPNWFSLSLLAAIVMVQLTTARYWHSGAPSDFQQHEAMG